MQCEGERSSRWQRRQREKAAAGMCGDGGRLGCAARCELCGAAAAVHCEADAAFLCAACDAKVHGANFLASRHRRRRVSAAPAAAAKEEGCGDNSGSTASASSSCLSTADSTTMSTARRQRRQLRGRRSPKRRARGEVVLEGWAKRMGLPAGVARRRAVAAGRALRACCRDVAMARVPLRVAMAAALWCEVMAADGGGAGQAGTLQRLEACSHVQARLVVAVASSMGRARESRHAAVDAEEGWDECP